MYDGLLTFLATAAGVVCLAVRTPPPGHATVTPTESGVSCSGRDLVAFMWVHLDSARSLFRLERASTPDRTRAPLSGHQHPTARRLTRGGPFLVPPATSAPPATPWSPARGTRSFLVGQAAVMIPPRSALLELGGGTLPRSWSDRSWLPSPLVCRPQDNEHLPGCESAASPATASVPPSAGSGYRTRPGSSPRSCAGSRAR